MSEEDIPWILTHISNTDIPLSAQSTRAISGILHMVWTNIKTKTPNARLASTYTEDMLDDYIEDMRDKKKTNTAYNTLTSGIPSFTSPATSTKSIGEKRYEAWNRKTPDKTKFDVLTEDKHYNKWKPNFEAELAHQKLSRVIDPNFDPSVLTCSYEKELWKDQQAYFWTVMLHVFQNPLGKTCITDRMKDKDSIKASPQA